MFRKKILLLTAILSLVFSANAQQISVKSFRALPNDMDARQNFPEKDQNGDVCAIIKVVTTEKGFTFDIGTLGITKTEQKASEIWVYLPHGAKRISIFHENLGQLRDYFFPEVILEGVSYELALTTDKVLTTIVAAEIISQWLIITSEPSGADIYLNDQAVGTTPYQNELPIGKLTWRAQKEMYLGEAGMLELVAGTENRKVINLVLKPNFGSLEVTTTPESGAAVSIDEQPTGKVTPCTIEKIKTGEHTITISRNQFATVSKRFTIAASEKLPFVVDMAPTFAKVSITTNPAAAITINQESKGNGSWTGRLIPGVYTVEAKLDKYRSVSEKRTIVAGQPLELTMDLQAITGTLKIQSTPFDAKVILNGIDKGTAPLTLNNLLIGDYALILSRDGYSALNKTITIKENETTTVDEKLENYRSVTIDSDPSGAQITLNGKEEGFTPKKLTAPFGNNSIILEKKGYLRLNEKFEVTQNKEAYDFKMISDEAAQIQEKYNKYRNRKTVFLMSASAMVAAGGYFYWHSEKLAVEYPTATTDATKIYDQMKREQLFTGIALGTGGACLATSIVFAVKQHQAKKKLNVSLSALPDHIQLGISMNF
jgi:hypothetical protein